jgi:hypothetical protein
MRFTGSPLDRSKVFPPFQLPEQRHRSVAMLHPILQFLIEVLQALLADELASRVRSLISRRGVHGSTQAVIRSIQRNRRDRLLHRLRTASGKKL